MNSRASKNTHPAGKPSAASTRLRLVKPDVLSANSIEQAVDLGYAGYHLVKLKPRSPAAHEAGPAIGSAEVKRILTRLDAFLAEDAQLHGPGKTENNAALLDSMEAAALERRTVLHEQGQLLGSADLCRRLGISRQALSKAIREQRMFRVEGRGGVHWYPAFFADAEAARRDIEEVSVQLGELPGDAKWQFFTQPKHSLDNRTPLQALAQGDRARVLRSAAEYKERSLGR